MSGGVDGPGAALADRYRIERELGAGGMATVYLAHDLKHERRVAIKVLRPELAAAIGAERFLREIRIAASLEHPHILTLIDSGEVPATGSLYYVMPFVEGETLRQRLADAGPLSVSEAARARIVVGFKAGAGPGFDFVAEADAGCDPEKGRKAMEDMITRHKDLDAVFSTSDSQSIGMVRL